MTHSQINPTKVGGFLLLTALILLVGCNKVREIEEIIVTETIEVEETNFPCAEGRECIDVCDGTLLVMQFGECKLGCTMYKDKLVGAYELEYALENCEVKPNSSN